MLVISKMEAEAMEAQIYQLYHHCWFRRLVLLPDSTSSPPPPPLPIPSSQTEHLQAVPAPPVLQCLNHRRSSSDSSSSPVSVLHHSKLDTILSGKESNSSNVEALPSYSSKDESFPVCKKKKKKKKSKGSKSLSELEYEELRGFMDLGFDFPKDNIDSELVSILPGLQRWAGKVDGDDGGLRAESDVARPYLSESWDVDGEFGDDPTLKMWRVPAAGDGVDMKDHLRCWAHAVASTFR